MMYFHGNENTPANQMNGELTAVETHASLYFT